MVAFTLGWGVATSAIAFITTGEVYYLVSVFVMSYGSIKYWMEN